jgi:hypothetical protein
MFKALLDTTKSAAGLADDLGRIALVPVAVTLDTARLVTTPVADALSAVGDVAREASGARK